MIDYWPLFGIALVVIGFALRFNPLLVVAVSAIATGLLAGMPFLKVLGTLGHAFNENRYVSILWIVLPVIGLLEHYGLQERAKALIANMHGATVGRLLILYMLLRQLLASVGLTSVMGIRKRSGRSSRRWRSPRQRTSMASWTRTPPNG